MYKVYLDGNLIYNPGSEDLAILDPKLELELNSAGQFTFTMPNEHPYYDSPVKMLSRVEVDRNDEMIFYGRIIDESTNFYKQKSYTCEGELAFLNDSIQPPAEYHDMTVREYLQTLIDVHNSQVEEDKQFTVGIVTVQDSNDSLFRYTNYNSTMTEIKEDLIDDLGGYLRVRHQGGVRYLDYIELTDYGETNDDAIRFGRNLLNFTQDMDVTDIATVIIPLGERLEESPIEALDMRLTIESVNDGKDWIQSDEAVETYGRIVKTVTWDDVTLPENLLSKGQRYLSDTQWDNVELNVTAIDMNLTSEEIDAFHLGDQLRTVSEPHGLDRYFPLSKMTLYLDKPESNNYTLGITTESSLIGQLLTDADLAQKLGNLSARMSSITDDKVSSSASTVLQEAKDNATILINAATTDMAAYTDAINAKTQEYIEAVESGDYERALQLSKEIADLQEYTEQLIEQATATGHVVIEAPYEEILIMDTEDKDTAQRVWRWNLNGLGYSKTGYKGEYGLAMTMDGAIVADYITTGTLTADIIRAGTLKGIKGNNYWDLDNGVLIIDTNQFTLDENGNATFAGELLAPGGKIGGWTIGSEALYNLTSSITSTTAGIYLGTDGIRLYGKSELSAYKSQDAYLDLKSAKLDIGLQSGLRSIVIDGGVIEFFTSGVSRGYISASSNASTIEVSGSLSVFGDRVICGTNNYGYRLNVNGSAYATGSWLTGSDEKLKQNIKALNNSSQDDVFFDTLSPVTFKYKDDEDHKIHFGLTYQNVVKALDTAGYDPDDCAVVSVAKDDNGNEIGAIAYDEIIALLVQEVQDLKAEVKELERKVTT